MPLKKKDLAHFEQRLLEERQRIVKQLAQFDESFSDTLQGSDGDLSAYSFHMADQGTDAMEREKAFLFASKEGRFLFHIDQALRRLYKTPDKYGACVTSREIVHQLQGARGEQRCLTGTREPVRSAGRRG
jgi:RNA polymerase-binding transcription factor DksA